MILARTVAAVLFGYITMAAWIFVSLSLAWKLLGVEFAFQPGSWQVSWRWIAVNVPLSFIGACMGGFVTSLIARHRSPAAVKTLATLLVLVGFVMAFARMRADEEPSAPPPQNIADVPMSDVANHAQQPSWYNYAIPLVGALGVLAGGRLGERRQNST